MLGFIRKLRRRLLAEGALGKYMAYAVGEILLVVIGILIALQAVYVVIGIAGFEAGVADVVMFSAWSLAGLTQRLVIRWIAKHHRAHLLRKRARLA